MFRAWLKFRVFLFLGMTNGRGGLFYQVVEGKSFILLMEGSGSEIILLGEEEGEISCIDVSFFLFSRNIFKFPSHRIFTLFLKAP